MTDLDNDVMPEQIHGRELKVKIKVSVDGFWSEEDFTNLSDLMEQLEKQVSSTFPAHEVEVKL